MACTVCRELNNIQSKTLYNNDCTVLIAFQDPSCSQYSVELVQSLSMVLDPLLRGGSKFGKYC